MSGQVFDWARPEGERPQWNEGFGNYFTDGLKRKSHPRFAATSARESPEPHTSPNFDHQVGALLGGEVLALAE